MTARIIFSLFYWNAEANKIGVNNPQFGVIKSSDTIAKLTKLVYVYNSVDVSYIGSYSTVKC